MRRTLGNKSSARPARGTPEETRRRLVAAAAEVINRDGYHGTDSNRIARAAGYAPGTFYKHFDDKRGILLAAYEEWVSSEWRAIEKRLRAGGRSVDLARRIVALVLGLHRRWAGLRASVLSLAASDRDVRLFYRSQRRRQLRMLRELRAGLGAEQRSEAEDAVLLFTLERTCDAIALGELRDLDVSLAETVAVVEGLVRRQIQPAAVAKARPRARAPRRPASTT